VPELFPRTQLRLTVPPGTVSKPRFWVERFCVWGEENKLVREIPLKPGLNIIWSPDAENDDDPIGHGAGKTTFCRLLRFCLGENSFGAGEQQDRIRAAFPTGKVGIEVHVDGVRWSIIRHFWRYKRDLIARDVTLEECISGEHPVETIGNFISAVQAAFFDEVHELLPEKVHKDEVWEAALAWLSRDQECRFDGPLDWRHSLTESESTVRNLKLEERSQVARAILGCFSAEEAVLEQEGATSGPSATETEADRLAWAISRQQRKMAEKLGADFDFGIGRIDADLLEHHVRQKFPAMPETTRLAVQLARQSAAIKDKRATRKLLEAQEAHSAQVQVHSGDSGILIQKRGVVDNYAASATFNSNPACPVCAVPLDRIFEEGCPCSTAPIDLEVTQQRYDQAVVDLDYAIKAEANSKQRLHNLALAFAQAKQISESASRELEKAEADEVSATSASDEGQRLLENIETIRGLIRDHERAVFQVRNERDKARERTEQLSSLRATSRVSLQGLSRRFDDVIRELIPGDVTGKVSLKGANLVLTVGPGERSTAAIDSWKAVAFDLSALTLACEGEAKLPPWLLHDSPREADLGESIYGRLFTFASALEQMAGFQYIVTTTTPPPLHMREKPYLRVTLKGGPATERLLGCTLS